MAFINDHLNHLSAFWVWETSNSEHRLENVHPDFEITETA
jgi:hypothetical protein